MPNLATTKPSAITVIPVRTHARYVLTFAMWSVTLDLLPLSIIGRCNALSLLFAMVENVKHAAARPVLGVEHRSFPERLLSLPDFNLLYRLPVVSVSGGSIKSVYEGDLCVNKRSGRQ